MPYKNVASDLDLLIRMFLIPCKEVIKTALRCCEVKLREVNLFAIKFHLNNLSAPLEHCIRLEFVTKCYTVEVLGCKCKIVLVTELVVADSCSDDEILAHKSCNRITKI